VREIFRTPPDRPWGPPILLYNGYRVPFPGVKRPGRGVNHPPPSSAEVKERVEVYLYSPSGPSWPVLGWTLPLPLLEAVLRKEPEFLERYTCRKQDIRYSAVEWMNVQYYAENVELWGVGGDSTWPRSRMSVKVFDEWSFPPAAQCSTLFAYVHRHLPRRHVSYRPHYWLPLCKPTAPPGHNNTHRQCTYQVTLRRVHETIVAVEKE
jgi:hypothetical protein